jgi:hypothetical protein
VREKRERESEVAGERDVTRWENVAKPLYVHGSCLNIRPLTS